MSIQSSAPSSRSVSTPTGDYRYHNFLKLSTAIKKHLWIQRQEKLSDDILAESLAYDLSEIIPSNVMIDPKMTVNEILDWARRKQGVESSGKKSSLRSKFENPKFLEWIIVLALLTIAIIIIFKS